MSRDRAGILAFALSFTGGLLMLLGSIAVVRSGYDLLCGSCHFVYQPAGYDYFSDSVVAWVSGSIIAIAASIYFLLLKAWRSLTSIFFGFAALVYWSGFLGGGVLNLLPPVGPNVLGAPMVTWLASPPLLLISAGLLHWISKSQKRLPLEAWLSLGGGFLMLLLAVPAILSYPTGIWEGIFPRSSVTSFLGVISMTLGGLLTILASLATSLSATADFRRRVSALSISGLAYYFIGASVFLNPFGPSPVALDPSPKPEFAVLGLLFSIPAFAATVLILKREIQTGRSKEMINGRDRKPE